MTRGRPRKGDDDALLDQAVDLIWREGPMALSLNEIASRLATTKPALARRFGGKVAFLSLVLERYHGRIDALVQRALGSAESLEGVARAYLGTYCKVLSQKPVGPATGCLLAAATDAYAAQREPAVTEMIAALNTRTRSGLVAALQRVGADRVEQRAQYLYGQSVSLAFLSRTGAGPAVLEDYVERALAGAVL